LPPARRSRPSLVDEILAGSVSPAAPSVGATDSAPAPHPSSSHDIQERLTVNLPKSLIERARTAVYYTPELTLAGLAATALERQLRLIEEERGEPFPAARGPLRSGRPIRQNGP
jgi:hypothetical protein